LDQLKDEFNDYFEDEDHPENIWSEESLSKSAWIPIIAESKGQLEQIMKNDPQVKEMDLAALSEKELFVRKANIVST